VTFTLLLSRGPGLAMHRKMMNDRWKAALQRAGITCDRYHMMHVTRQETYSHMMPDDRERARKAIERFFARPDAATRKTSGLVVCPECALRAAACPGFARSVQPRFNPTGQLTPVLWSGQ
jgi:hypothetical protein